jgi:tetratricopeptide (TPR) repeat protein
MKDTPEISPNSLKKAFYCGDYKRVLSLSLDAGEGRWDIKQDAGVVLGALVFLGRVEEAKALYDLYRSRFSQEILTECRFFLGLGLARRSEYAEARRYFGENLREHPRKDPKSRFFAYQGIAFFRYFCGRWRESARAADRAFRAAIEAQFFYGRVLSSDLRGHIAIQTENVSAGFRNLIEAEDLARKLGNEAVAEAIEISILTYEAQYGLNFRKSGAAITTRLAQRLKQMSVQDTYSRASLLLELSRQFLLRGKAEDAERVLDQASQIIYMNQNRRQEVTLNLRYAYLCKLRGDYSRGLSFVQSAKRALDPRIDHALELAVLGQELALLRSFPSTDWSGRADETLKKIHEKSVRYGGSINRQMIARAGEPTAKSTGKSAPDISGDAIGTLKNLIHRDPPCALGAVMESGMLTFLYEVLSLAPDKSTIYLDLQPAAVTVFDRGHVEHKKGLTPLSKSLLQALANHQGSKEELVRSIWGYSYHPLRHDPMVYSAIAGLRKLLSSRAQWIETTEKGYRLASEVELKITGQTRTEGERTLVNWGKSELNHRQIRLLDRLKSKEFVGVQEYRKLFKVSEVTAFRDLAAMHRSGHMVRVGRARATRYSPSF